MSPSKDIDSQQIIGDTVFNPESVKPLKEGDTVDLTLTTDKGATVKATVPVKKGQMMR